jgi:hypothetical protein
MNRKYFALWLARKAGPGRKPLSALIVALACFASQSASPTGASANTTPFAGGLPSAFLDQNSVGWLSVRNMTSAQFSAYFDEQSRAGYMVIDIEVDEIDGVQRVGAVWQKNTDGRGWLEKRNLTDAEFHDLWDQLLAAHRRPQRAGQISRLAL